MEPVAIYYTKSDTDIQKFTDHPDACQAVFWEFKRRLFSYSPDLTNLSWSLFSTKGCDKITNFSSLRTTFHRWVAPDTPEENIDKELLNPSLRQRKNMRNFWKNYINDVNRTLNHGLGTQNVILFCLHNNCFKDLKENVV